MNYRELGKRAATILREIGDIDPASRAGDLSISQQQIVEIARALSVNSRILIMDEPTSALSATEVEVLFKVIHDLTSRGVS
ncbi:ATP-binding cassette domain-containing protein, partial [Paraburkholderia sp. SIMBA_027]|uniref:ATP-binding cassette domain-containing protein n=1 Tax=Paraburkholderia sp. SIMBA_027 TaxID=3085770 RepID=UPI00397C5466